MKLRLPYSLRVLLLPVLALPSALAAESNLGEWMAIGDSITHGTDSSSYRWYLQKVMIDNGISYSTVGYHSGCFRPTDTSALVYGGKRFDDHNNHSAQFNIWTDEIAGTAYRREASMTGLDSTNIGNWLGTSTVKTPDKNGNRGTYSDSDPVFSPDTYTVMLGTNDLNGLRDTSMDNILANMKIIADTIGANAQANDKQATAYIMSVTSTNYSASLASNIAAYNRQLSQWTGNYSGSGVKLVYVDINRGLSDVTRADGYGVTSMYASDNLHPTDQASLIIAGNLAQGMGYAGRTAGQQRRDATDFATVQFANGFGENTPTGENISLREDGALDFSAPGNSSLSFDWGEAQLDNGFTVDFSLTLGDGAVNGWNTSDSFSVSVGDGTQGGTLRINEAYIQWGDTILFSRDMSSLSTDAKGQAESLRVAYLLGNVEQGLNSGYYVWLGDMLIGEALSASSSTTSGVTLSYDGSSPAVLHGFAMDNSSWAPTSSLYANENSAWQPTPDYKGTNGTPQGNVADWSAANQGATVTNLLSGSRLSNNHYFGNYSGDSGNIGNCTTWDFTDTNTWDVPGNLDSTSKYLVGYGLGDRTVAGEGVRVRISGNCPGFAGVYGIWGSKGTLTGNVTLQLDAANATYGYISGAGNHSIDGTIHITLNAGTVSGHVAGGFTEASSGQSIGGVELFVNGGLIRGSLYGGNAGDSATHGVITGDVTITMTGGTLVGNLYGGGSTGTINGHTHVTITGGTIYGNVDGGSCEEGKILGSSSVTVESSRACIRGSITGNTVTLKDVADSGSPAGFDRYAGQVTATHLVLHHVTANRFDAAIHAEDITVSGGTHTHLARLESVQSIYLESGSTLSLTQLLVGEGQTCSIQQTEGGQGGVTVTGLLRLGTASTLSGDITLGSPDGGYILASEGATARLEGKLTLNAGGSLSDDTLSALSVLSEGSSYTLLGQVDELELTADGYSSLQRSATLSGFVDASTYFTNLEKGRYSLTYDGKELSLTLVPEPTSAALALLALTALAARRRRS